MLEFQPFKFGQFPIGYKQCNHRCPSRHILKLLLPLLAGNGTVELSWPWMPVGVDAAGPPIELWNTAYVRIARINEFCTDLAKYAKVSETEARGV